MKGNTVMFFQISDLSFSPQEQELMRTLLTAILDEGPDQPSMIDAMDLHPTIAAGMRSDMRRLADRITKHMVPHWEIEGGDYTDGLKADTYAFKRIAAPTAEEAMKIYSAKHPDSPITSVRCEAFYRSNGGHHASKSYR